MEPISAVVRRTVPIVSRNPKKLRNKAKCSKEVGFVMNGAGIGMAIVCFSQESRIVADHSGEIRKTHSCTKTRTTFRARGLVSLSLRLKSILSLALSLRD
jgi:hypothetical protein